MNFIHEDAQFDDLLRIVAADRKLEVSLVEKDYWVTHALWSLHQCDFELWFKGGTSLSKGFGLIQRFSEDLDLKVEAGRLALPAVRSWTSDGAEATRERAEYFGAVGRALRVPGAEVVRDPESSPEHRDAKFRVVSLTLAERGSFNETCRPLYTATLVVSENSVILWTTGQNRFGASTQS